MKVSTTKQLAFIPTNDLEISLGSDKFFVSLKNLNAKKISRLNGLKKETDKLKYIMSLAGVKTKVEVPKFNVFIDPLGSRKNHFLNLLKSQSCNSNFKKPISNAFHFGIEIECIIPHDSLDTEDSSSLGANVSCYECEGRGNVTYTHRDSGSVIDGECPFCEGSGEVYDEDAENNEDTSSGIEALKTHLKGLGIKGLHVKSDSSIDHDHDDSFSVEIACLTTDFKNLEKLCNALKALNASVNKSCGLHVHLDMRGRSKTEIEVIEHNLKKSLDILFACVPESRRVSNYCQKRVANEKYSAFNTQHLNTYGTIECRLHSGSTDFEKIKNWCLVLKSIVDRTTKVSRKIKNISDFKNAFNLSEYSTNWITSRHLKFSGNDEIIETETEQSEAS